LLNFQQFWTQSSLDKNKALVEYLKQYDAIRTDKVAEVMETVDRALFVTEGTPYIDSPMPIGFNATISAPHMHATCLELLKDHLQQGMQALDVGSGPSDITVERTVLVPLKEKQTTSEFKYYFSNYCHLTTDMHSLHLVGSGFLTACFAMMVGPEGRAVGIEHIPDLVAYSIENVRRSAAAPLLKDGALSFHVAGILTDVTIV
jgi:protein-L-isoaspartate(D-aspartate) O-methyltransferase